jgi:hypothetical protein
MSNRPVAKSAFEGLRPTILRQPSRSPVPAEAEARLLEKAEPTAVPLEIQTDAAPVSAAMKENVRQSSVIAISAQAASETAATKETTPPLLQKKRREVRELVSFRLPLSLREKLASAAEKHEISQTDLICESIELNIQRYL